MAWVNIIRREADKTEPSSACGHPIAAGDYYCYVDLAPGRQHRGNWGYVERYCELCATVRYARYRAILAKLRPEPEQPDGSRG